MRALGATVTAAAVASSAAGQAAPVPAAPNSSAADGGARDPGVAELLKRLDVLEERNRELEAKVTDLNRQQGEEWLGEQRAAQIREVVRDVLADSEARASLRDGGMTAGWNDGFFLGSADGRFRMNVGGFTQARFIWSSIKVGPGFSNTDYVFDRQENRYGFDVPQVQLWADGHIFSRDFTYMVKARFYQQFETELNKGNGVNNPIPGAAEYSAFELMDAWARIHLDDNWSVRAGQFRSPYSRGFLVMEQYQMTASRSVVDYHYALGYTQGLEFEYANDEFRGRMSVNNGGADNLLGDANAAYGANGFKIYPTGSYGTQNAPFWAQTTAMSFTGRFDWKPAGSWDQFRSYTSPATEEFGLLMGLGLHYQQSFAYQPNNGTPFLTDPTNTWFATTLDAQVNFGGASFYGAFFYNYLQSPGAIVPGFGGPANGNFVNLGDMNIFAFQTMAATYIIPKVELFGRYEFALIDGFDANAVPQNLRDPDPLNLLTVGVNWYLDGQDLKWTTDLGWAITPVHPWFADIEAGWRPSNSDEIVFRTQLQLMF